MTQRVFDQSHYDSLNSSRGAVVWNLLSQLKEPLGLRTAIDVGCGLGYFSSLLKSLGFEVTGVDGRQENVEEARRRNPGMRFERYDAEDPAFRELGRFDVVFCFGLLYHLENPLLVIRHLNAMTNVLLLVESVIFPGEEPVMGLVDESPFEDQGLSHLAFYPTEACLEKMMFRSGFSFVYAFTVKPDHPGFRNLSHKPRVRTMLAASRESVSSDFLTLVKEPHLMVQPWDPDSVFNLTRRASKLRRLVSNW